MNRTLFSFILLLIAASVVKAQDVNNRNDDSFAADGYRNDRNFGRSDSIQNNHKIIPRGLRVWTIDERFGDKHSAVPDTMSYMYMNSIFTTGLRSEFNALGNLGAPRQNRIFIDRSSVSEFLFTDPYNFIVKRPSEVLFTSTLSPITVASYNTAGNRTNGEDHFNVLFAVNAGRKLGAGFQLDYLYGRGYYANQSTSHINYSMWAAYQGERYQSNLLLSLNHQKVAENGGIASDAYITHPESFSDSYSEDEIPTILKQNWNRNDNQHIFYNHRYSLGFFRKVPMTKEEIEARKFAIKSQQAQAKQKAKEKARKEAEKNGDEFDEEEFERQNTSSGRPDDARIAGDAPVAKPKANDDRLTVSLQDSAQMAELAKIPTTKKDTASQWMKDEYVPVTSFIHTVRFDNFRRLYQAYQSPANFYANNYYASNTFSGDSIYDRTRHWSLKNTIAVALLEGFNKWAKAGVKIFASHELRHYELPTTDVPIGSPSVKFNGYESWNKHDISIGGQLLKSEGKALHYDIAAEAWLAGDRAGQLHIDGHADLNFSLLGDTVRLAATAFLHRSAASFYMNTFRSRHFWWDNNLEQMIHSRVMGEFALKKIGTKVRVGYDLLKNYTYFGLQNNRRANGDNFLIENLQTNVRQESSAISLLTLQLQQNFSIGPLNWENVLTLQKSSKKDVLPVPLFNAYTNLYLRFKIAKVLHCDLGADLRYFTEYYAPEYIPGIGAFGIQETAASRTKIGNYPVVNVYANFLLQHTRFFIMMSHVNNYSGGEYFFTPHYPLNGRIFRVGLSWNFFN